MLIALLQALRKYRWLRQSGLGYLLSSIGSGITFVVIFGGLLNMGASASSFAVAYILTSIPGVLGSQLSSNLCNRGSPFAVLIGAELLGAIGLSTVFLGIHSGSIICLQLAQGISAFAAGMLLPPINLISKQGLTDAELPVATVVQSSVAAAYVLFGVGVGVLLYGKVSPATLLMLDGVSYVLSIGMLARAWRSFGQRSTSPGESQHTALRWHSITAAQRRALLMLPLLALVGTPAMALLPALVPEPAPVARAAATLPLLFARSLGQLLGAVVVPASRFSAFSVDNRALLIFLACYLACYYLFPNALGIHLLAPLLILLAHIFSNIVFALATYSLLHNFGAEQVARATAQSYRWQVGVSCLIALGAGELGDRTSAWFALCAFSTLGLALICTLLLARWRLGMSEAG